MIGIIIEGIKLLKAIYEIKDQLDENNTTGKRLCERVSIFEKFLLELEAKLMPDLNIRENNDNETSLEASLRCLVSLLKEMKEYLEKFLKKGSTYGNTKRFVLSVAYRNDIAKNYTSFNQRITDCVNNLMPNLAMNFEEQRQLDAESLHNQVEKMSNKVVEELNTYLAEMCEVVNQNAVAVKENQTEFQHYLTECNSIAKENATTNDLILTHIVELQKKIESKKPLVAEDLKGVQEAIYAEQVRVQTLITENLHSFTSSLNDVKELIHNLQSNADKEDEALLHHLEVIHKKIEKQTSLNMKEFNELKQVVKAEHKELIDELETKFQSLNLLSVQTDLKFVKDLMGELIRLADTSSQDNHSMKEQLTELEKKIGANCSISQKDLNGVKRTLQEDQLKLFGVIEQKFSELDILSVRADLSDVKNLIQDVKCAVEKLNSSTDNNYEKLQQQVELFETKFFHNEAVNANELKELQTEITLLGESGKALFDQIFAKMSNLDLIESLETRITEGNKVITDKLDVILDRIMNYQSLTREEKNSRDEMLKQLYIKGSVSITLGKTILGEGGFGKVSLAKYGSQYVAVKALKKTTVKDDIIEAFENEVLLMRYLSTPTSHPNILQCFGIYEEQDNFHIVLDYAKYGSLAVILAEKSFHLPVRLKVSWLCDLISAIKFIHSKNVKHRDIKAENLLLLGDLNVKLSDFGLSKQHSSKQSSSMMAGTMNFMAPEMVAGKGSSFASDIFSWGLTFYQIIMRQSPNRFVVATSQLIEEVFKEIEKENKKENYLFDRNHVERFKWGCLMMCVDESPMKRPSAPNVLVMLSEFLEKLGGDPRDKSHEEDREMMRNLEDKIDDLINGLPQANLQKLSATTSPSKPSSSRLSGLTTPSVSGKLSSSGNDDPNNTSNNIHLKDLNHEEAVELLVDLGCVSDLKDRVLKKNLVIDGKYLQGIKKVSVLQALEDNIDEIREPALETILDELKELRSAGLSAARYNELKAKVRAREEEAENQFWKQKANDLKEISVDALKEICEKYNIPAVNVIEKAELVCLIVDWWRNSDRQAEIIDQAKNEQKQVKEQAEAEAGIKPLGVLEERRSHGDFTCERTLSGHSNSVLALIQLADGRIASGSYDNTIKIWNVANRSCEMTLSGHIYSVRALVQLADGRIASGSHDRTIKIWNMVNRSCEMTLSGHIYSVRALIQLADGRIASGSVDTTIKIWNVINGSCERTLSGGSFLFASIHLFFTRVPSRSALIQLADGRIASGSWDKTIRIWNLVNGSCELTLSGHSSDVYALIQLADGRIASGSVDTTIRIWNVVNGSCELTLSGHSSDVSALIQLADGRIASGSSDSTIKIWNVVNGSCEMTLSGHSSDVYALIQLADGRIASGSDDKTIKIWKR